MKNKKGFTLIELLVTIALMLSILGIAIMSFITISNNRKDEAWKKVKNQTEVAAEEYIKNNEYLLSGKDSARISIGRLVSQDYLNEVVNPKTGTAVNNCDFVYVKNKNGSSYSYEYKEYDGGACDADDYLSTSEPGGPIVSVDTKGTKRNGWYVDNKDAKIVATVGTNNNGPIKKVEYCLNNSCKVLPLNDKNEYIINNNTSDSDGENVSVKFIVTNSSDKTAEGTIAYNKDTVKPKCTSNNGSTKWINSARTITWTCSDSTSGCVNTSYSKVFDKSIKTGSIDIADKAGNTNTCNANVYVDVDKPTCSVSPSGTKGNKVGNLQWYKSDVEMNLTYADTGGSDVSLKGLDTSKKSTNGKTNATQSAETKSVTWNGYVKDAAGNEGECDTTFGLEKSVTLSLDLKKTNNTTASSSGANGGKVFKNSNTQKYSDTNSGNCKRKQDNSNIGCAGIADDNYYFGISCMYVGDYVRYFNVSSMSYSGSATYGGDTTATNGINYKTTYYYPNVSTFNKEYVVNTLSKTANGNVTFSIHNVSYTSPAGNTSNHVYLYTQYSVDCGYKK